jgi:hypothetical protein
MCIIPAYSIQTKPRIILSGKVLVILQKGSGGSELVFLKIHGARCGVEKGTQMGGLLGGEG